VEVEALLPKRLRESGLSNPEEVMCQAVRECDAKAKAKFS
jgi:hypothetical protein